MPHTVDDTPHLVVINGIAAIIQQNGTRYLHCLHLYPLLCVQFLCEFQLFCSLFFEIKGNKFFNG